MARKPRKESKLQIYHVIMRGNNRQSLFFDDADKEFFKNRLFKYSEQLEIKIYSYCLMGNHVHILLGHAPKEKLSRFVQKLANSYVYFFNHKYDCSGHLFQGRFKSEPVEDEVYLKNVLRYILNNPNNAKIASMEDYEWSSFKELTDYKQKTLIDRKFVLSLFGSYKTLKDFLVIPDKEKYMEYENRPYLSDRKAILIIQNLLDSKDITLYRSFSHKKQMEFFHTLKSCNLALSQIARLTGFPLRIIKEA